MHVPRLLLLLLLLSPAVPVTAVAPPTSPRAEEVIARVRPGLEARLREKGLAWGAPVFLRIFKDPARLEVWLRAGAKFKLFAIYRVCFFSGSLGPKTREGDNQAPEGFYFVPPAALNPSSNYHLSFNLGYPNAYDQAHGFTGSLIMVHGSCVSIGCFAMTDARIEEIYALVDAALRRGQPFVRVHVFPFPLSRDEIERRCATRAIPFLRPSLAAHRDFWLNLLEGYEWFERRRVPPDAGVARGRYVFRTATE